MPDVDPAGLHAYAQPRPRHIVALPEVLDRFAGIRCAEQRLAASLGRGLVSGPGAHDGIGTKLGDLYPEFI